MTYLHSPSLQHASISSLAEYEYTCSASNVLYLHELRRIDDPYLSDVVDVVRIRGEEEALAPISLALCKLSCTSTGPSCSGLDIA